MLALVLSAFIGTATPAPPPASPPVSPLFLGIALGDPSKSVSAALGKPKEVLSSSIGDIWRYSADRGNATLDVAIAANTVVDIAARVNDGKQSSLADPLGGALGMTAAALSAARGAPAASLDGGGRLAYADASGGRWVYTIDGGVVTGIELASPVPPPPAAQVIADARHDGSAVDRAILVNAATEADGVQAEMSYLGSLSCDGGGRWQVTGQELVPAGGRYYDLIHTACSVSKHPRDFYFDSTSFYGK